MEMADGVHGNPAMDIRRLEISVENVQGALLEQQDLPLPPSETCSTGRLIQPALTTPPGRPPVFQIGCKVDPTSSTPPRQEVWLFPAIGPNPTTPKGGDYWELTWTASGWLSMCVDPRTGGGPGTLMAASVTGG